jgi:hypothetical protein
MANGIADTILVREVAKMLCIFSLTRKLMRDLRDSE